MAIQVAVCGPSDCTDDEARQAREVGRLLAERGAVVLCGGYGGVMAAAAEGAAGAGGIVIGILSGGTREGANPHLTVALPTGLGEARNAVLVRAADAVIAVGGSWGTLSEVAFAMRIGTPVTALNGWHLTDPTNTPIPGIHQAATPAAAVRAALHP